MNRGVTNLELLAPIIWPDDWRLRARVLLSVSSLFGSKYLNLKAPQYVAQYTNLLSGKPLSKPSLLAGRGAGRRGTSFDGLPRGGEVVSLTPSTVKTARELLAKFVFARIGSSLLHELKSAAFADVSTAGTQAATQKAFDHLHAAELDSILQMKSGEWTSHIIKGSKAAVSFWVVMMNRCLPLSIELAMVLTRMHKQGTGLAPLTAASMVGYVVFTTALSKARVHQRRLMAQRENMLAGVVTESLFNAETIRLFGAERAESLRFGRFQSSLRDATLAVARSLAALNYGQQAIMTVAMGLTQGLIVKKIADGSASVGDLAASSHALLQLSQPLNFLGTMYREVRNSLDDMGMIRELFALSTESQDKKNALALELGDGEIEFKGVNYSYAPRESGILSQERAVKHVSFKIKGGSRVAFVGPSGAGKSTLVKLLMRIRQADSGTIAIDGQDVLDVTAESIRSRIGVVPQDVILFNDTLVNNVKFGKTDATNEEVKAALKAAKLENFIEKLPEGLETPVGERGSAVSGGERQRIGMARCLLKNPEIFILDEATSNLDANTERDVIAAFRRASEGKTSIIIAHRFASVVDADEIFYVDEGEVKERGSHAGLMALDGAYAKMYNLQKKGGQLRSQGGRFPSVLEASNSAVVKKVLATGPAKPVPKGSCSSELPCA